MLGSKDAVIRRKRQLSLKRKKKAAQNRAKLVPQDSLGPDDEVKAPDAGRGGPFTGPTMVDNPLGSRRGKHHQAWKEGHPTNLPRSDTGGLVHGTPRSHDEVFDDDMHGGGDYEMLRAVDTVAPRGEVTLADIQKVPGSILQPDKRNTLRAMLPSAAVKDLRDKVEEEMSYRTHYCYFWTFLLYFALSVTAYWLQFEVEPGYRTQEALFATLLSDETEAVNERGEIDDRFDTDGDMKSWVTATIGGLFADPQCGDSICESSELQHLDFLEYTNNGFTDATTWNAHMCQGDCGTFNQTTDYILDMSMDQQSMFAQAGNYSSKSIPVEVKLSLLDTTQTYVQMFLRTMNFATNTHTLKMRLSLPDGKWKLDVKAMHMYLKLRLYKAAHEGNTDLIGVISNPSNYFSSSRTPVPWWNDTNASICPNCTVFLSGCDHISDHLESNGTLGSGPTVDETANLLTTAAGGLTAATGSSSTCIGKACSSGRRLGDETAAATDGSSTTSFSATCGAPYDDGGPAVSDDDCGDGFVARTGVASSACATAEWCDVTSEPDKTTCCIEQPTGGPPTGSAPADSSSSSSPSTSSSESTPTSGMTPPSGDAPSDSAGPPADAGSSKAMTPPDASSSDTSSSDGPPSGGPSSTSTSDGAPSLITTSGAVVTTTSFYGRSVPNGTDVSGLADTLLSSCTNGGQDGDETGVDCGGSCPWRCLQGT